MALWKLLLGDRHISHWLHCGVLCPKNGETAYLEENGVLGGGRSTAEQEC